MTRRLFDIVASSLMLLLLSPLLAAIAVAIRLDSPGPIIFHQVRVGRFGRTFAIRKFRTMFVDADPLGLSPRAASDPRVTRMGRFLRCSGLDELPQLVNIFRGEMTFIGPRPQLPEELEPFQQSHADLLEKRVQVRPGITSLWIVTPGGAKHHPTVEMLEADCVYVDRRSWWLDLTIAFKTVFGIARGDAATTRRDGVFDPDESVTRPHASKPTGPGEGERREGERC